MPATLTNHDIAEVFAKIALSLEVAGESRYRFQAYQRAADSIGELPAALATYRERGELEAIPNIGKTLADKIIELLDTGQLQFYEKLKQQVPPGVLDLMKVPSIGPRTAGKLYKELGIDSLAALKQAADTGKLAGVKGFGAKTIAGISAGITAAEQADTRVLMGEALAMAEQLLAALREAVPLREAAYAGSLRRGRETTGDLDILAAAEDTASVVRAFTALPMIAYVDSSGDAKATAYLHSGMQVDLYAVDPAVWGAALHHFTGSRAHNIRFRELALAQGMSFSEHGFKRLESGETVPCATEQQVYATVGLPWIAPELREDAGEFEAAQAGALPRLVELADIRADLHMHSTWSDGKHSIRAMAEAAMARGYSHMAITDHSAYLGIVNGLDAARLKAQAEEIRALNAELGGFRILRGVEVDITPDGGLALPDEVLAELDIVVASPHVQLRQPAEQATERILKAIRNPHVDIIGHPTGRLIGGRAGAELDIDAVARAAAETNTLLEVNSGPDRLDLSAAHARRALELGALLVTDSDAHHTDNLAWIRLGVVTARRGWAAADQLANTWDLPRLLAWLAAPKPERR
ncbi:DNA polymerase/3'-5' exonuclease PolX [Chloroflexia bacterium SDU3-3]|nr:DNA polymerase/3'-5' exonuclease PolX [Chloroflexia bacterium SDU3-3]